MSTESTRARAHLALKSQFTRRVNSERTFPMRITLSAVRRLCGSFIVTLSRSSVDEQHKRPFADKKVKSWKLVNEHTRSRS